MFEETLGLLFAFVVMVLLKDTNQNSQLPQLAIRGKVTDLASGKPIPGVLVVDDGLIPVQGAVSGKDGTYCYRTWRVPHLISARMRGYAVGQHVLEPEIASKEVQAEIDFALKPATHTHSDRRAWLQRAPMDVDLISVRQRIRL